jgi:hypothetical protein
MAGLLGYIYSARMKKMNSAQPKSNHIKKTAPRIAAVRLFHPVSMLAIRTAGR